MLPTFLYIPIELNIGAVALFDRSSNKSANTTLPALAINHFPPSGHERLHLYLTVTLGILRATVKVGHKVAFLVDTLLRATRVRINRPLRHQRQFRQDRAMPSEMRQYNIALP